MPKIVSLNNKITYVITSNLSDNRDHKGHITVQIRHALHQKKEKVGEEEDLNVKGAKNERANRREWVSESDLSSKWKGAI